MSFWGKRTPARVSVFRQLQLENWKRQLDTRITRAVARGDAGLLNALRSEQAYLEQSL